MNNTLIRYALVLTVIAVVSGAALAYFNGITAEKIAENRRLREQAAVSAVLGTETFTTTEIEGGKIYSADTPAGKVVAFTTAPPGFSGPISLMVSVNVDQERVEKIVVLEHGETPGLGARITEAAFTDQFAGKSLADPFRVKHDVQVITGATISTRAVTEGVKAAADKVVALVKAGVVGE